ncbi:MAG: decarboxylating 6-phosphogluconate dehydrogenase [Candidatus Latescibacteria bacterium]|nr:decarboxylating 6-phosphogluconate dehydrogenase [Candidatus Latescibacterota bacterium]
MQLAMIGLGRMGANIATRLIRGGHQVVAYDLNEEAIAAAEANGASGARSLSEAAEALDPPRVAWVMVPSGDATEQTVKAMADHLKAGDTVIDGGNSNYRDTMRRGDELTGRGLHYVDVGTSGGIWGLDEGYSMMVGGETGVVARLRPIFEALAPASDRGWGHVGPSGAGHFVKMVHNGIEYGMMQAFAEGFSLLKHKEDLGLDLHQVAEIWRHGSVVRSWLLDLIAAALEEDAELSDIAPYVSDSGEGRWTVAEAVDLDVPASVITLSLIQRLRSRDTESYADRLLAAMRNQFGGHEVKGAEATTD